MVAAYPKGSPDIKSSTDRVPAYTETVKKLGVEIVDSIETLLTKVDVVLLETNDGRPHFEQVLPVLRAKKPVFVDKPVAGSLRDGGGDLPRGQRAWRADLLVVVAAVFAGRTGLAWRKDRQDHRLRRLQPLLAGSDPSRPVLVRRARGRNAVHGDGARLPKRHAVVDPGDRRRRGGVGGRPHRHVPGIRAGSGGYGGTAFGETGVEQIGPYGGYRPLMVEIVKFFRTGQAPVSAEETIEIFAFMEAADESKRQGGKPVESRRCSIKPARKRRR